MLRVSVIRGAKFFPNTPADSDQSTETETDLPRNHSEQQQAERKPGGKSRMAMMSSRIDNLKSKARSKASKASVIYSNVRKGELPSVKSVADGVSQKMRTLRSNLGHNPDGGVIGPDNCSMFVRTSVSCQSGPDAWKFLGQTNTEYVFLPALCADSLLHS